MNLFLNRWLQITAST